MNKEILKLTCRELRDSIAEGNIKSSDAVSVVFERIEKHDKQIGAFLSTFKKDAFVKAEEVDEKICKGKSVGVLAGVPISL